MVFQILHFDFRIMALFLLFWAIAILLSSFIPGIIDNTIRGLIPLILAVYILISTKDIVFKYKKRV